MKRIYLVSILTFLSAGANPPVAEAQTSPSVMQATGPQTAAEPRRLTREESLPPRPSTELSGEGAFPQSTPVEENGAENNGFSVSSGISSGIGSGSGKSAGETGGYGITGIVPKDYKFALRANLLHWATLTPDLGVEWRMGRSFSLLAHGTWTRWRWDDGNRRFHLWRVAPEFRWYLGLRKRWHLGVEYHTGGFDFLFAATGHRGTFNGGSAVGGYQLDLGRRLSLDLTLGFGGTSSRYRDYELRGGSRIESQAKKDTYIGINQAAVSLGWRFGSGKR